MLRQRLHQLYSLLLHSKKISHSSTTGEGITVTAVDAAKNNAIQLLYHRDLKSKSCGTCTNKSANVHDWIVN